MEQILTTLPSPIEILFNPISYIIYAMFGALIIWETLFPAKQLPTVSNWKFRSLVSFLAYFLISSYLPLIWDGYLGQFQLLNLTGLGTFGGTIVGLLVFYLGEYAWHRLMHKSNVLWRVFHQMHHSAERLDTYGAFYFSPMDMIGWTALGSFTLVVVAGFTPQATTLIILLSTFLSIFQHMNVKTPVWLGYIVQRPEAHTIHHAKGIHAYNYAGITLFDILFGTFKNPKEFEHETGFYNGASARVMDMVLFKDVSNPETEIYYPKNTIHYEQQLSK